MRHVRMWPGILLALAATSAPAAAADYPTRPVAPRGAVCGRRADRRGGTADRAGLARAARAKRVRREPRRWRRNSPEPSSSSTRNPTVTRCCSARPGRSSSARRSSAARYDVEKELATIGLVWRSPQVLAVNPKLGVKTMAEFVALAKTKPGKLNVGSAGNGTTTHLSLELLKREAGIDLVHVPYRSTGAGLPDLLSGQVDAAFGDVSVMTPQVAAKSLVGLATTRRSDPRCCRIWSPPRRPAIRPWWWRTSTVSPRAPACRATCSSVSKRPCRRRSPIRNTAPAWRSTAPWCPRPRPRNTATLLRSEAERWGPIARAAGLKIE